jgi:threonine dehydrogenase-like Zn-dependent dehydrogenase
VVLAVRRAGICNTDLEIARGYMGFQGVLGHELVAQVVEGPAGSAPPADWAGRRVTPEINCACRGCPACTQGRGNHCPTRTVLGILGRDGGLAERVAVPLSTLHAVPDSLDDDQAVFIEPLAAALHAFDDVDLTRKDRVLLLGDGKLGLLIGLALAARRGQLGQALAVGRHPDKLAILAAAGLEVALETDFDERGSFDLVIEATGSPQGLTTALEAVRPQGTLVLKSTYAGAADVDLAPVVINEVRVVGSRCGDFPRAIAALENGHIDPRPLISERFSLNEAERAFARAAEPGVIKVLVDATGTEP